jgi:hypothetical protein
MKKEIRIALISVHITLASYAMNAELSPSLQIFKEIGDIRAHTSKLYAQQKAIMEQLRNNIEMEIKKTAALLEEQNIPEASDQLEYLKECSQRFEKVVQCVTNSQNASSASHIQSKL